MSTTGRLPEWAERATRSRVYMPKTMIGRAALAIWNLIGKNDTPLQEANHVLGSIRAPDMELVRLVAQEIGQPDAIVDLCWTHMIDAIRAESEQEEKALADFGA